MGLGHVLLFCGGFLAMFAIAVFACFAFQRPSLPEQEEDQCSS